MTITTLTTTVSYVGNGNTIFGYPFKILDATHLLITLDGVVQVGGYSVSGVGANNGGDVTFAVAPGIGVDIDIARVVPLKQLVDYRPYDAFPAEVNESGLDALVMMMQQVDFKAKQFHHELLELGDDDHPQYHNDARGDARYVNITGDTMTGPLNLSGNPTQPAHAATKDYVDAFQSGIFITNITSNATGDAQGTVQAGWNAQANAAGIVRQPNEVIFYKWPSGSNNIYKYNGNQVGPAGWASVAADWPQASGIAEAPTDSVAYARKNTAWVAVVEKSGGGYTGHITVPAGAAGSQVPRRSEIDATFLTLAEKNAANGVAPLGANVKVPPINAGVPPGVIFNFGGALAQIPAGYLPCDGAAVSRATYADLFAAIGILWGAGDGVNTFNVPTSARMVEVGSGGAGTGVLGNAVGNIGGTETHVLTIAEMPAHTHTQQSINAGQLDSNIGGNSPLNGAPQTGSTGGGGAHNNMQPSMVVLRIIKT